MTERATKAIEAWFIDHDGEEIDFAELARLALEASGVKQLQRENARYRDALEYAVEQNGKNAQGFIDWQRCVDRIQEAARAALREQGRSVRVEDLTEEDVEAIRNAKPRD